MWKHSVKKGSGKTLHDNNENVTWFVSLTDIYIYILISAFASKSMSANFQLSILYFVVL